jgi:two-component system nitrogen regulation response regulator GlnG
MGAGAAARVDVASPVEFENGAPLKDHVKKHIAQIERQIILEALKSTKWNKAKTARMLQIAYNTLLSKINEYDLQNPVH